MTLTHADFAVLGASPLARLIAGLLATVHGKSVVFMGESQSGYRLPSSIDLSVGAITRPETWALLTATLPEATRLIQRIGRRSARTRLDPIIFADAAQAKDALGHVRHMAAAFGLATERMPESLLGRGREGLLLRDAIMLHRPVLEPALDRWLEAEQVVRLGAGTSLDLNDDGSGRLVTDGGTIEVGQTILADDAAIFANLPAARWPGLLVPQSAMTVLTEPTSAIAAPVMQHLDSRMILVQQPERGIAALGTGPDVVFSERLVSLLGKQRHFRRAGQSAYQRIVTADGAPAAGRIGGVGVDVLAGFGCNGAFLAPAIARWLCGVATDAENAWLGERLVTRASENSAVADLGTGS